MALHGQSNGTSSFDLFVDPMAFFRAKVSGPNKSLYVPTLLVLTACLISLYLMVLLRRQFIALVTHSLEFGSALPPVEKEALLEAVRSADLLSLVASGFLSFTWLIYWPLGAVLLANIAVLMNKDYRFRDVLHLNSYAFATLYPSLLLSVGLLLFFPLSLSEDPIRAIRGAVDVQQAFTDVAQQIKATFPVLAVRALNWVSLVWLHLVFMVAFRQLYGTKWWQASLAVSVTATILGGGILLAARLVSR